MDSEFRNVSLLTEAVEELALLRYSLDATQLTRPFGRAIRLAQLMSEAAVVMVQRYLDMLMAATPVGAQTSAEQAQCALDDLSDLLRELSEWLTRRAKVSEAATVQDSLWVLVADSMQAVGEKSLLSTARSNQERLLCNLGVEPEIGVSIEYGISSAFADIFLSPETFQAKLKAAFELLVSDAPSLDVMLRDPLFERDLERLQLEIFDSGVACQRAIADALHLRQEARAIVELNASLVESAGLVLGVPLLTAVGQKSAPYATLRLGDASDHVRKAQDNRQLSALFAGLDHHLRTAQAHRAVSYGEESLITDLKSGRRDYTYDALTDSTFEAVESVLASLAALKLARAVRGIEGTAESGLESLGFSPADIAKFTFSAFGFPDCAVAVESNCLHVELGTESMRGVTIAVSALLGAVPPSAFTALQVVLTDGTEWLCQMDAYAAFGVASNDFEKQIALMRVQAGWTTAEGASWLTAPVVRKWVASQVTETMDLETHERFKRLRLLRAFVEEVGQPDVAVVIRRFVRWARLDLLGQQGGEPERKALSQIVEWATMKVEFAPL